MENMQRDPDLVHDFGIRPDIHITLGCLKVGSPTHDTSDIAPVCGFNNHLVRARKSEGEKALFIELSGISVQRAT